MAHKFACHWPLISRLPDTQMAIYFLEKEAFKLFFGV
jgi:hypothetical protein